MNKRKLHTSLALFLAMVIIYPLLVQSFHVWHNQERHTCHIHHHVDLPLFDESDHEHTSPCYICSVHIAPGILSEGNKKTTELDYNSPQKFALYTCFVQPYDGSSFALRAPPIHR